MGVRVGVREVRSGVGIGARGWGASGWEVGGVKRGMGD